LAPQAFVYKVLKTKNLRPIILHDELCYAALAISMFDAGCVFIRGLSVEAAVYVGSGFLLTFGAGSDFFKVEKFLNKNCLLFGSLCCTVSCDFQPLTFG